MSRAHNDSLMNLSNNATLQQFSETTQQHQFMIHTNHSCSGICPTQFMTHLIEKGRQE